MNLNLRKARKLESAIYNKEKEISENGTGFSIPIALTAEAAMEKYGRERKRQEDRLSSLEQMHTIRYKIRGSIAGQNEKAGLNTLITRQKELTTLTETYKSVLGRFTMATDPAPTLEDLKVRLETEQLQARAGRYGSDKLHLDAFNEEDAKAIRAKMYAIKQELESIEDKINYLNLQGEVTLSEEEVGFLRGQELL